MIRTPELLVMRAWQLRTRAAAVEAQAGKEIMMTAWLKLSASFIDLAAAILAPVDEMIRACSGDESRRRT
jgi:hypothetical protein